MVYIFTYHYNDYTDYHNYESIIILGIYNSLEYIIPFSFCGLKSLTKKLIVSYCTGHIEYENIIRFPFKYYNEIYPEYFIHHSSDHQFSLIETNINENIQSIEYPYKQENEIFKGTFREMFIYIHNKITNKLINKLLNIYINTKLSEELINEIFKYLNIKFSLDPHIKDFFTKYSRFFEDRRYIFPNTDEDKEAILNLANTLSSLSS